MDASWSGCRKSGTSVGVVQPDKSYKYYANFDWYNHYFKKNRPMQDYNVSVTGGSKRVNYYVSGRIYKEDGMIRQNNDKFESFSTRAKLNVKITDWLKYGVNMCFLIQTTIIPAETTYSTYSKVRAFILFPIFHPRTPTARPFITTNIITTAVWLSATGLMQS